MQLQCQHVLTGDELTARELGDLIDLAIALKKDRLLYANVMQGKHLALLFEKPSLRTRMSFTVAMQQLGGQVVESVSHSRKSESPEDQIRVIQGYCQFAMFRIHQDSIFEKMIPYANIPIINGLSDTYHPCQILADLVTLKEKFKDLNGLSIAYVGDGNNILYSLMLMAPKLGMKVHYSCPKGAEPTDQVLRHVKKYVDQGLVKSFAIANEAVVGCDAVYTDVWTSMGFEQKSHVSFKGYQVNEALMQLANKNAVVMHCMPMERGKEISETLPDQACSVIFQQSENRLHAQKALLIGLVK